MKKNNLLIWASDLDSNTGEGVLARSFINEIVKLYNCKKIKIKTFEQEILINKMDVKNIKLKKVNNSSLFHRYLGPIYGAIYLLVFSRKYKTVYLNYLPLWNFVVFFILSRQTILGPVTGGVYKNSANNLNLVIRKYLFPIFYKISTIIILKKFKKIIFSTSLLKPYRKNNFFLYDFVTLLFSKKTGSKKKNMI